MLDITETENGIKRRSYRSCISTAYNKIAGNLRKITKDNWRWFLPLAILEAALGVGMQSVLRSFTFVGFDIDAMKFCVCLALMVVCNVVFTALAFRMINGKEIMWNIFRCVKTIPLAAAYFFLSAVLCTAVTFLCVTFIKDQTKLLEVGAVMSTIFAIGIFVFVLPLVVVFCKYMANPDTKLLKTLLPTYAAGMRALGFIFVTLLLATLCACLVYMIVGLPVLVLNFIYNVSAYGMASMGDPEGLPSYYTALCLVVGTVECFIKIYVALFLVYVSYYVCQTVECKAQDRKARIEAKRNRNNDVVQ